MARALGVSADEVLGETGKKRRASAGPTGRMRRLFEAASKLPRSQQEKIAAVIEAFVNQHSDSEVCAEAPRVRSGAWRAPHAKPRSDTSPLAVFETRLRWLTNRGSGVSECKHGVEQDFHPVLCGA